MHIIFWGRFYFYSTLVFYILRAFFFFNIIPLALVGCEMIIISHPTSIIPPYLISHINMRSWNNIVKVHMAFVMHICGAKFQEHCFNISRDIVYSVFYHFLVANNMTSSLI